MSGARHRIPPWLHRLCFHVIARAICIETFYNVPGGPSCPCGQTSVSAASPPAGDRRRRLNSTTVNNDAEPIWTRRRQLPTYDIDDGQGPVPPPPPTSHLSSSTLGVKATSSADLCCLRRLIAARRKRFQQRHKQQQQQQLCRLTSVGQYKLENDGILRQQSVQLCNGFSLEKDGNASPTPLTNSSISLSACRTTLNNLASTRKAVNSSTPSVLAGGNASWATAAAAASAGCTSGEDDRPLLVARSSLTTTSRRDAAPVRRCRRRSTWSINSQSPADVESNRVGVRDTTSEDDDRVAKEWQEMARILDRLCFWIMFGLMSASGFIIMFYPKYTGYETDWDAKSDKTT